MPRITEWGEMEDAIQGALQISPFVYAETTHMMK